MEPSIIWSNFRKRRLPKHILFWGVLYLYYVVSNWTFYDDKIALIERFGWKTGVQILFTYWVTELLVPLFLHQQKRILFVLSSLLSAYLMYVGYTLIRYYYFDPKYRAPYSVFDLYDRLTDFSFYLNELTWFIFPGIVIMAGRFYRDQQEMVLLREQKKTTELNLLKNQLNPHFLFNTLNNLYTLALKKSDQTPIVIAKLSAILDYILYHCQEKYVALADEITLINNYLELEQLRYGPRLSVEFEYKVAKSVRIAPLILLTFVENAFKHGVKEEIGEAVLNIQLQGTAGEIVFEIQNSKPVYLQKVKPVNKVAIGLANIRQQLDLLYPQAYQLSIQDNAENYRVCLKLQPNEV